MKITQWRAQVALNGAILLAMLMCFFFEWHDRQHRSLWAVLFGLLLLKSLLNLSIWYRRSPYSIIPDTLIRLFRNPLAKRPVRS